MKIRCAKMNLPFIHEIYFPREKCPIRYFGSTKLLLVYIVWYFMYIVSEQKFTIQDRSKRLQIHPFAALAGGVTKCTCMRLWLDWFTIVIPSVSYKLALTCTCMYSGTPLKRTPSGQCDLSFIERCPKLGGNYIINVIHSGQR